MTMRAAMLLVALLSLDSTGLSRPIVAQDIGELDLLLDQLGRYLIAYEDELSTVVAEELYDQQEIRVVRTGRSGSFESVKNRRLRSDVAFLRLPNGSMWFGVRDVRTVDKKSVANDGRGLLEIMKRMNREDAASEATRIVAASAQHNLGGLRTINMPTTPLEILHPNHHVQFMFKVTGRDKIDGVVTTKLTFQEFDVPTIINSTNGEPLFISGTAWVEPGNGRLWRVEMMVKTSPDGSTRRGFSNRLRVDFMVHPELKIMVPKEMTESFYVVGGRGNGRAKYTNYKRFGTTARIIPN